MSPSEIKEDLRRKREERKALAAKLPEIEPVSLASLKQAFPLTRWPSPFWSAAPFRRGAGK